MTSLSVVLTLKDWEKRREKKKGGPLPTFHVELLALKKKKADKLAET